MNAAAFEALRPEVERLAALGVSDSRIAVQLTSPMGRTLSTEQVRRIRKRFGIPASIVPAPERAELLAARPDSGRKVSAFVEGCRKARTEAAEHIRPMAERKMSDRDIAAALNAAGIPTAGGAEWTRNKVQGIRKQFRIGSGVTPQRKTPVPTVPAGHDAHCYVCDAPVLMNSGGRAIEHQRLTSMVIAGVRRVGRCEGSLEQVVFRPVRRNLARAA